MYRLLTGKQRSLVFPVMCNAHVKIDYSDNIPKGVDGSRGSSDDITYGIWNHTDSFTIESTFTPYDINGYALKASIPSTTSSERSMGGISKSIADSSTTRNNYTSFKYLAYNDKENYEMRIFHSTKAKLSLLNVTDHALNNPSQYKIRFALTLNSTTITLDSPIVIAPVFGKPIAWASFVAKSVFDADSVVTYAPATTVAISSNSGTTVTFASTVTNDFHEDQLLYIQNGFDVALVGKIAVVGTTTITLDSAYSPDLTGSTLVVPTTKNPLYANEVHHVAATYNQFNKKMTIYYGGVEVASTFHTQSTDFSFDREDFYLGANGSANTGANSAKLNNQFMGELHEFAFVNGAREQFDVTSLNPRFTDALLYFRFEEVDE
tara:strand:+ start:1489 stop:2622 length:1134 start_codon:yes stop_codon:yes gene_type:complete